MREMAANAHTLQHQCKSLCRDLRGSVVRSERLGSVRIGERGIAGVAAPTLDSTLAVGAESLGITVGTPDAGHGFSPLDFCGKKPQNKFASRSWLIRDLD